MSDWHLLIILLVEVLENGQIYCQSIVFSNKSIYSSIFVSLMNEWLS